jgi:hypothetical protein
MRDKRPTVSRQGRYMILYLTDGRSEAVEEALSIIETGHGTHDALQAMSVDSQRCEKERCGVHDFTGVPRIRVIKCEAQGEAFYFDATCDVNGRSP